MLTSQVLNEDTQYFLKELFLKCSLRKFFEYALPIYNLLKHPLIRKTEIPLMTHNYMIRH